MAINCYERECFISDWLAPSVFFPISILSICIYPPAASEFSPEKPIGSRPPVQVMPPAGPPSPCSRPDLQPTSGKTLSAGPSEQVLPMTHTCGFNSFNLKQSEPATPPIPNLFAFLSFNLSENKGNESWDFRAEAYWENDYNLKSVFKKMRFFIFRRAHPKFAASFVVKLCSGWLWLQFGFVFTVFLLSTTLNVKKWGLEPKTLRELSKAKTD